MTDFDPCHCSSFQSPVVSLSNNEVSSDKVHSSVDDHDSSDKSSFDKKIIQPSTKVSSDKAHSPEEKGR